MSQKRRQRRLAERRNASSLQPRARPVNFIPNKVQEEVMGMIELEMANHLIDAFQQFILKFKTYSKLKTQRKNTTDVFQQLRIDAEVIEELITNHKGANDADDSEK